VTGTETLTVHAARENVLRCALDSLRAERKLADENGSVPDSLKADDALSLACRDLTAAVTDQPYEKRPKGWG
jgi:hypothetical protein